MSKPLTGVPTLLQPQKVQTITLSVYPDGKVEYTVPDGMRKTYAARILLSVVLGEIEEVDAGMAQAEAQIMAKRMTALQMFGSN